MGEGDTVSRAEFIAAVTDRSSGVDVVAADVAGLNERVDQLGAQVDELVDTPPPASDPESKPVSRNEFENEIRRFWDGLNSHMHETDTISRTEFDTEVRRLWE